MTVHHNIFNIWEYIISMDGKVLFENIISEVII